MHIDKWWAESDNDEDFFFYEDTYEFLCELINNQDWEKLVEIYNDNNSDDYLGFMENFVRDEVERYGWTGRETLESILWEQGFSYRDKYYTTDYAIYGSGYISLEAESVEEDIFGDEVEIQDLMDNMYSRYKLGLIHWHQCPEVLELFERIERKTKEYNDYK